MLTITRLPPPALAFAPLAATLVASERFFVSSAVPGEARRLFRISVDRDLSSLRDSAVAAARSRQLAAPFSHWTLPFPTFFCNSLAHSLSRTWAQ